MNFLSLREKQIIGVFFFFKITKSEIACKPNRKAIFLCKVPLST